MFKYRLGDSYDRLRRVVGLLIVIISVVAPTHNGAHGNSPSAESATHSRDRFHPACWTRILECDRTEENALGCKKPRILHDHEVGAHGSSEVGSRLVAHTVVDHESKIIIQFDTTSVAGILRENFEIDIEVSAYLNGREVPVPAYSQINQEGRRRTPANPRTAFEKLTTLTHLAKLTKALIDSLDSATSVDWGPWKSDDASLVSRLIESSRRLQLLQRESAVIDSTKRQLVDEESILRSRATSRETRLQELGSEITTLDSERDSLLRSETGGQDSTRKVVLEHSLKAKRQEADSLRQSIEKVNEVLARLENRKSGLDSALSDLKTEINNAKRVYTGPSDPESRQRALAAYCRSAIGSLELPLRGTARTLLGSSDGIQLEFLLRSSTTGYNASIVQSQLEAIDHQLVSVARFDVLTVKRQEEVRAFQSTLQNLSNTLRMLGTLSRDPEMRKKLTERSLSRVKNTELSLSSVGARPGDRVDLLISVRLDPLELPRELRITMDIDECGWGLSVSDSFMLLRQSEHSGQVLVSDPGLFRNYTPAAGVNLLWTYHPQPEDVVFARWLVPSIGINVSFPVISGQSRALEQPTRVDSVGGTVIIDRTVTVLEQRGEIDISAGPVLGFFDRRLFFSVGWNLTSREVSKAYVGWGFSFVNLVRKLVE